MKAILMSHENGGSYVMDKEGFFQFVRGYGSLPIGTEIDLVPQAKLLVFSAKAARLSALAACLVVAVALGSFAWLWSAESYSVFVDINPSVELVFNDLNKLKETNPLNEDGADLVAGVKLKGSPEKTVIALIKEAEHRGYLNIQDNEPAVSIMIAERRGKNPGKILAQISAALEKNGMSDFVDIDVCSADFRAWAEDLGVSPNVLKLAEQLFSADQSVPIGELVKMPITDLKAAAGKAGGKSSSDVNSEFDSSGIESNADNSTEVAEDSPSADTAIENGIEIGEGEGVPMAGEGSSGTSLDPSNSETKGGPGDNETSGTVAKDDNTGKNDDSDDAIGKTAGSEDSPSETVINKKIIGKSNGSKAGDNEIGDGDDGDNDDGKNNDDDNDDKNKDGNGKNRPSGGDKKNEHGSSSHGSYISNHGSHGSYTSKHGSHGSSSHGSDHGGGRDP
ncbi:MAG: hypothetical protein FWG53_03960, partial [Clostridiales bacterium]|nr:hypothetical protein [Clostridiales bacterium]